MTSTVLELLAGVEPETRKRIVTDLELRLGHSLEETAEYEQPFVERELRILLWIETEDTPCAGGVLS